MQLCKHFFTPDSIWFIQKISNVLITFYCCCWQHIWLGLVNTVSNTIREERKIKQDSYEELWGIFLICFTLCKSLRFSWLLPSSSGPPFPIFHWYSWCLIRIHLFTFCANSWSTHLLWKFMDMFGDHRDSLQYQGEIEEQEYVLSEYL